MESIVKYHGDIQTIADSMGLTATILSENYAIMDLSAEEQFILSTKPQIEYIEEQKLLSLLGTPTMTTPCITAARESYDLTGKGVLIAAVIHGVVIAGAPSKLSSFCSSIYSICGFVLNINCSSNVKSINA